MVLGGSSKLLGGFKWQASGGFSSFYIVSRGLWSLLVLVSTGRLNIGLDLMCHFCSNIYFILAFVQNFNHFDSQPLQTLEWIFVAKDFCTFAGIYVGPCYMSYILFRKFRTSEMLDKWNPTSKLSGIKLCQVPDGQYIFSLARESTCPPYLLKLCFYIFKSFPMFIMIEFWVLNYMSTFPT